MRLQPKKIPQKTIKCTYDKLYNHNMWCIHHQTHPSSNMQLNRKANRWLFAEIVGKLCASTHCNVKNNTTFEYKFTGYQHAIVGDFWFERLIQRREEHWPLWNRGVGKVEMVWTSWEEDLIEEWGVGGWPRMVMYLTETFTQSWETDTSEKGSTGAQAQGSLDLEGVNLCAHNPYGKDTKR